jgi:hypothetical protein
MFISRFIPIYCQFVRTGETADLFHSFAPAGNELICAFRRHKIVDFAEWGSGENFYESRTMVQRFDISTCVPISEPEEAMAKGEDPRCISVRGRPFILSANPCGGNFNYVLFDVRGKKCLNIEVANRTGFKYGKNWQPFVAGETMYAVHGFSPFRILRIDVDTGCAEIVFEKSVGLDMVSPHDGYSQFRGGCSAMVLEDKVVGFGHLTIDSGRHSLFQWTFCPSSGQVSLSFDPDITPLADWGLKIIDPTCFFTFQGKHYLGVSCSSRDWFYGQTFVSLLLELQLRENGIRGEESLASVLRNAVPPQEKPSLDSRTVHFFRAAELMIGQGIRGRNFEVLSRAGTDDPGHMVYGPYINLHSGIYQVRLQYAGAGLSSQEIGELDVCSNSGSSVLAKRQLFGTNGELSIAVLDCRIPTDAQGVGVEVRVASRSVADMRLTDVSISKVS